jgi:hypothetical protein
MSPLKTLRSYQSLIEAEGARSYLEAHGIEAQLPDRHSLYQQPHLIGVLGGARLQVPESQYEEAEELLQQIERRSHLSTVPAFSGEDLKEQRQKKSVRVLVIFLVLFVLLYGLLQALL